MVEVRATWLCCVGVTRVAVVGREGSCPCLGRRGWSRACGGTSGMDAMGRVRTADWRGASARVVGDWGETELELDVVPRMWGVVSRETARPSCEEEAVETGEASLGHVVVEVATMGDS